MNLNIINHIKNIDVTTLFISLIIMLFSGVFLDNLPMVLFGIFLLLFISCFPPKLVYRFSIFLLLFFIIISIFVLFNDFEIKGSKRWFKIINFYIQTGPFLIVFFIIFAGHLLEFKNKELIIKRYNLLFFVFIFVILILLLQPYFMMSFLLIISFFMQLIAAGLTFSIIILTIIFLIILFLTVYFLFDHVQERIDQSLNLNIDTYQADLGLRAINEGGVYGLGAGQGSLFKYIPDANTEFVFARIAHDFGIVGSLILFFIFLIIIFKTLYRAYKINNDFCAISIIGLISFLGFQFFFNIFSVIGFLPNTAINLPLFSASNSSILSSSVIMGICLSFSNYKNIVKK